jgi:hypothetical protein
MKRYGFFIAPFGYVYAGDLYSELRFTPDAAKAALGKSYTSKKVVVEGCDTILHHKLYDNVQIVTYDVKCTVEVEPAVSKAELKELRKIEYADKIKEYKELTALYDSMTGPEVDKLPVKTWNYYQSLKHVLLAMGLT